MGKVELKPPSVDIASPSLRTCLQKIEEIEQKFKEKIQGKNSRKKLRKNSIYLGAGVTNHQVV